MKGSWIGRRVFEGWLRAEEREGERNIVSLVDGKR